MHWIDPAHLPETKGTVDRFLINPHGDVLTARDGWPEKVEGFKAGADDYLTKPFRVEELVMQLRAVVRRAAGHADSRALSE